MEEHLGRSLQSNELVHHRNHDRLDNRIENLELMQGHSSHMKLHGRSEFGKEQGPLSRLEAGEWSRHFESCASCGTTKRRYAGRGLCWKCYERARKSGALPSVSDGRRRA
jgi:hypothetical protein